MNDLQAIISIVATGLVVAVIYALQYKSFAQWADEIF